MYFNPMLSAHSSHSFGYFAQSTHRVVDPKGMFDK